MTIQRITATTFEKFMVGAVSSFHARTLTQNAILREPFIHTETSKKNLNHSLFSKVKFGINNQTVIADVGSLVIAGPLMRRRSVAFANTRLVAVNTLSGPSKRFLYDASNLEGMPTKEDKKRFIDLNKIHLTGEEVVS